MKRIAILICLFSVLLSSCTAHAVIISGAKTSGDYEYYVSGDEATIVYYNGNFVRSVTIPSTLGGKKVTTIDWGAFSVLKNLQSVSIPDSVVTLDAGAFLNSTGLKTVSIGNGVKNVSGNPFEGCSSLKTINLSSNHPYLQLIDGVLFTKNPMRLICYPGTKTATSYTLPNGVVEIADSAFAGNYHLKTLVIPASVTTIEKSAFYDGHSEKLNITLDVSQNEYAKSFAIKNNINYIDSTEATPPPPSDALQTYSGSGDNVVVLDPIDEWFILEIEGNKADRHFSVIAYDKNLKYLDLLVNTSDPYHGFVYDWTQSVSMLEINAEGAWSISVKSLFDCRYGMKGSTIKGSGDEVILLSTQNGKSTMATIKGNSGNRHFAITGYNNVGKYTSLYVNTSKKYDGRILLSGEPVIFQIEATGAWEITFE